MLNFCKKLVKARCTRFCSCQTISSVPAPGERCSATGEFSRLFPIGKGRRQMVEHSCLATYWGCTVDPLFDEYRLDKSVVTVSSLTDESDERAYWHAQTPEASFRRRNSCDEWCMAMRLPQDFKDFLRLINLYEVEYLLVGGYAVTYHGYPRATGDVDIWVAATPENQSRLAKALIAFGFSPPAVSANFALGENQVIRIGVPPVRIDLLTTASGVTFNKRNKFRSTKRRCRLRRQARAAPASGPRSRGRRDRAA